MECVNGRMDALTGQVEFEVRDGLAVSVRALARVDADVGSGGVWHEHERLVALLGKQAAVEAPLDRVRFDTRPCAHVAVQRERRALQDAHTFAEPRVAVDVQANDRFVYE